MGTKYQGGINKQLAMILKHKTRKLLQELSTNDCLNNETINIISNVMNINAKLICDKERIAYAI